MKPGPPPLWLSLVSLLVALAVAPPASAVCPNCMGPGAMLSGTGTRCITDDNAVCPPACEDGCVGVSAFVSGAANEVCAIEAHDVHLMTTAVNPNVALATLECIGTYVVGGQRLGGDFLVTNTPGSTTAVAGLQTLSLPVLDAVQGTFRVATGNIVGPANSLASLTAPAMTAIGSGTYPGSLQLEDNSSLTTLNLGSLASVAASVIITGNGALPNLGPAWPLTAVGADLSILDNDALTTVATLAALTLVQGDLTITGNALLTNVNPLGGIIRVVGVLSVLSNPSMTIVRFGGTTRLGGVWIRSNNAMGTLSFPALQQSSGDFTVELNSTLATLNIPVLNTVGATYDYSGNNPAGLTVFNMVALPVACGGWNHLWVDTITAACPSNAPLTSLLNPLQCAPPLTGQVVP